MFNVIYRQKNTPFKGALENDDLSDQNFCDNQT